MFKLLKHDIKDSYFEVLILNGILIGLSLILLLGARLNIMGLFTVGIVAWSGVLTAVFVIMVRAVIRSFHTKLFTDNGYLTLTTPVSVDKVLISKIIVSLLHVITTVIGFVLSMAIFASALFGEVADNFQIFRELWMMISANPGEVILNIIYALAYVLYYIIVLLFILILSNIGRMKTHKVLKGILIYIVFSIVTSPVGGIRIISTPFVNFLINLAFSVVLYFTGRYLIINKLELE